MHYCRSFRIYAILLLAFSIASCSSGYNVVRSNRSDYSINRDLLPDSNIIRKYLPYKAKLDAEMSQVIGHSAVLMSKKSSDTLPESLLSNFFSDAVLQQALKMDANIDFALPSTKGGLRVDLPKGNITVSNVFELMPFENELVIFNVKGTEVKSILNFIASTNGQPVSRLKMKIRNKTAVDVLINGKPLNPDKTYRILTSDYIGGGGDNVPVFKGINEKKVLGLKIRDALLNHIKETEAQGKTLNPELDGRITKA
ncbi:5'-nucleotidase [Pedobacter frigoris]|uniref:5'-nucleotidase n=1 Tax=Pedobacter frigoris TaxID=2571272 RepID=UPI00292D5E23|nr:5'-nucleotidase [Pedobacter frigoris]